MTDIVERLRVEAAAWRGEMQPTFVEILDEAVGEIERLRSERDKYMAAYDAAVDEHLHDQMQLRDAGDECDRLREALRDCVETWRPLLADADLTAHENPAYLTLMRADLTLGEGTP